MKFNSKKIVALCLGILLIAATAFMTISALIGENDKVAIAKIQVPALQDGKITGTEYGTAFPILHLTEENGGFWAEDTTGNKYAGALPSYIDVYLAHNGKSLFVGVKVQEADHVKKVYDFDTFLGSDADSKNSGKITKFRMTDCAESYANGLPVDSFAHHATKYPEGELWYDFQPYELIDRVVDAGGNATDTTTQLGSKGKGGMFTYHLPHWAGRTTEAGTDFTVYEVELDLAGAKQEAFFSFDLGLFGDSTSRAGTLHCSIPTDAAMAAPLTLDLVNEPDADSNNNTLASLSVERGKLEPDFSADKTDYTLTLPEGVKDPGLVAVAASDKASVTIKGIDTLSEEKNIITVKVAAPAGAEKTYQIEVVWDLVYTDFYVNTTSGSDSNDGSAKDKAFKTLDKAFEAIEARGFSAFEGARIRVTGTIEHTEGNILFGQKTIFNSENGKLPITLVAEGSATLNVTTAKVACANDYTFDGFANNFNAISSKVEFYAGSGEITFKNMNLGTKSYVAYFADNFTQEAYIGWTEENRAAEEELVYVYIDPASDRKAELEAKANVKKIPTSITFGEGVTMTAGNANNDTASVAVAGADATAYATASGALNILPIDTQAKIIVDGGKLIAKVAGRRGNDSAASHVYATFFTLNSGFIHRLGADSGEDDFGAITRHGDYTAVINDGNLIGQIGIKFLNNSVWNGDVTFEMHGGAVLKEVSSSANPGIVMASSADINGNTYMNLTGGYVQSNVANGTSGTSSAPHAVSGEVINRISGGSFGYFAVANGGSADKCRTYISGGTFRSTHFAGDLSYSFLGGSVNGGGNLYDNEIYISGGTFYGKVYMGNSTGVWGSGSKNLKVNISGNPQFKTLTQDISKGFVDEAAAYSVYSTTMYNADAIAARKANITADIAALFTGGHGRDAGGNSYTTNELTISGGLFEGDFIAGNRGNVTTKINNISGGTFKGTFYGGGLYTHKNHSITNNISGGTFEGEFYGGNQGPTGNITNNISGGKFSMKFVAGSASGSVANITNNISGNPEFVSESYLGTWDVPVSGKITNTIDGGTFRDATYGGTFTASIGAVDGVSIENTINDMNHRNVFYGGCGRYSDYITEVALAGSIKTTVNGGYTRYGIVGGNRRVAKLTVPVDLVINDIDNDGYVIFGNAYNTAYQSTLLNASSAITGTIAGGDITGDVYGLVQMNTNGSGAGTLTADGSVAITIKGGTIHGNIYASGKDMDASKILGNCTVTFDLTDMTSAPVILGTAKVVTPKDGLVLAGGLGKLVLGANTNIVATSATGTVQVEQSTDWTVDQVYVTIPGQADVKALSGSGVKGSGVIKVESGNTKVVGGAENQLFVQLLIGDRVSIRALFVKSAVGDDFEYSFSYDGKTVSGTKADLATVTVSGVEYYAVTLEGFGASSFDVEVNFSGTGYADNKFSITSLAETAEAAWAQQGLTEWVEVAKAVQNLSDVYNSGAENAMTPEAVEGSPVLTKYPLSDKIQTGSLSVAPIMNGAVGLRFRFTLTEAPADGLNVEVGGLNVNDMGNIKIEGNNVTADLYFNAAYGLEKVNILFLDGSTGYFCVNTSVAQIVSQCMNSSSNSDAQRANAAALLVYLQTVSATKN